MARAGNPWQAHVARAIHTSIQALCRAKPRRRARRLRSCGSSRRRRPSSPLFRPGVNARSCSSPTGGASSTCCTGTRLPGSWPARANARRRPILRGTSPHEARVQGEPRPPSSGQHLERASRCRTFDSSAGRRRLDPRRLRRAARLSGAAAAIVAAGLLVVTQRERLAGTGRSLVALGRSWLSRPVAQPGPDAPPTTVEGGPSVPVQAASKPPRRAGATADVPLAPVQGARTPTGLKVISSRGLPLDCLEVLDGAGAA